VIPGEILPADEPVRIDAGLPVTRVDVINTGPVPIHLTAHFHVFEANPRLRFDRRAAFGMRLKTHAKGSVRFESGETKSIELVPIGGARIVHGFNGAVNGPLAEVDPDEATARLVARGFLHEPEARS
jgi:urease beta subunit